MLYVVGDGERLPRSRALPDPGALPRPGLVSVVMPVFNGSQHIMSALESILTQTYTNIELVVVDDGSSDNTWDLILSVEDDRMIPVKHASNLGMIAAINTGLSHASGVFIARQDADDISHPDRIGAQYTFLEKNPRIAMVGTWARVVGTRNASIGSPVKSLRHPIRDSAIRWVLLRNSAFVHGSVMIRRQVIDACGGYPSSYKPAEDYYFWCLIGQQGKLANIPQELIVYAQRDDSTSSLQGREMADQAEAIGIANIQSLTHGRYSQDRVRTLLSALNGRSGSNLSFANFLRVQWLLANVIWNFTTSVRRIPIGTIVRDQVQLTRCLLRQVAGAKQ